MGEQPNVEKMVRKHLSGRFQVTFCSFSSSAVPCLLSFQILIPQVLVPQVLPTEEFESSHPYFCMAKIPSSLSQGINILSFISNHGRKTCILVEA